MTLATMRGLNAAHLPHTCAIQTATEATDSAGRRTVSGQTTIATVAARLSLASDAEREQLAAAGLQAARLYLVVLPGGTPVLLKQQLVVTGSTNGVAFSHTLQVEQITPPDRAGEVLTKVLASEATA